MQRPRAIFLNSARLNYDGALCFARLSALTDLTLNSVDSISDDTEIANLVNTSMAEIIITKEMTVSPSAIKKFTPGIVKLMCEAGTGYNK